MRSHRKNWVGLNRGCYLEFYVADGGMAGALRQAAWVAERGKG